MFAPVPTNPGERAVRKFGWSMLGGFAVLAGALLVVDWYRHGDAGAWDWNGGCRQWVSVVLGATGALLWAVSLPGGRTGAAVYRVWMGAARWIGIVMSTIALTLFYFVLLPPFVLLVRGHDPLRKRLQSDGTYWEEYRAAEPTLDRMRRLF